jgi:glycosyltransferase involved in cell wall biosynthesis
VKISIVIPAFNEERLLAATLGHLHSVRSVFTARGWESELIVCNNNSTDQTAEIALTGGARVVFEPINQIGRARNRGAEAATGDWLLFVDADSQPSAELLAEVAEQIAAGKCLAGGVTIRLDGDHPGANFVTQLWNWVSRWRRLLAGSFIFCEAAAFRKIGGFSHEFFTGEELDLTRRLRELATATGRGVVILHRHPLLTSDRKVRLYTLRENLGFMLRAALRPERVMKDKAACYPWYDGRR